MEPKDYETQKRIDDLESRVKALEDKLSNPVEKVTTVAGGVAAGATAEEVGEAVLNEAGGILDGEPEGEAKLLSPSGIVDLVKSAASIFTQ